MINPYRIRLYLLQIVCFIYGSYLVFDIDKYGLIEEGSFFGIYFFICVTIFLGILIKFNESYKKNKIYFLVLGSISIGLIINFIAYCNKTFDKGEKVISIFQVKDRQILKSIIPQLNAEKTKFYVSSLDNKYNLDTLYGYSIKDPDFQTVDIKDLKIKVSIMPGYIGYGWIEEANFIYPSVK